MKRTTTVLAAVAALTLAACGTDGAPSSPAVAPEISASTSAPAASATPAAAPVDPMDDVAKFGQTWTYADGIEVTVSAPKKFKPSAVAESDVKGAAVKMKVKVTNGTSKPFEPALILATASSGGTEANQIFDFERGLQGSPSTAVRPGKSVTYAVGFDVFDPKNVLVEVTPGFEYSAAVFTQK